MAMPASDRSLSRVLAPYVPGGSRSKGRVYEIDGLVTIEEGSPWHVRASVRGTMDYEVHIERRVDAFTASCECRYFEDRFEICKHIWATLLDAEQRGYLMGEGSVPDRATIAPSDPWNDAADPEFAGSLRPDAPRRVAEARPWERFLDEVAQKLTRAEATTKPPRFATQQIAYVIDRANTLAGEGIALELHARSRKKNGEWGKPKSTTVSFGDVEHLPEPADRDIIPLLLGASDPYGTYYAMQYGRGSFRLIGPIVDRALPAIVQTGRALLRVSLQTGDELILLTWDDGPAWTFRLEVVHSTGQEGFSIDGALVRGNERMTIREPWMVLASGFVFHGRTVARLDDRHAFAWLAQLRGSGPMVIPPDATGRFVDVLARSGVDPSDLPDELHFDIVSGTPRPSVNVRAEERASPAAPLSAHIVFDYDGLSLEPGTGATAFDGAQRKLIRRDLAFEQSALTRLLQLGFARQWDYGRSRERLIISPGQFASAVRTLVREGWKVEAEGRAFRPAQSVQSEVRSGIDWFELHGAVDFGGGRVVQLPRLLENLRHGKTTVTLDDGTEGMVPEDWLRRWAGIAGVGETEGDHVRFTMSQVALLDAMLASEPAVHVDERFLRVRDQLTAFSGISPMDPASSFVGELRDYQREALGWFEFLRRFGFGGCLADDMGLGKTVMVLAWLDRLRAQRKSKSPSLVVVPRSVVFNWKEEAQRFAPNLRVLDFSGSSRSAEDLRGHDLVLTTYGTLRRDIVRLRDVEFEYAILDEAQAIKNASTAAAKAARLVRARHRLALSGTPVENHLGELWSIFEFLNPGLLGTSSNFAQHSLAAAKRDPEAVEVLARGLRPFILRRTKAQVAPELPDRTEQTLHCDLGGLQRDLYNELRDHYRASLLSRIERDGVPRSRMHILEALLRLRQAACHPGLVDERRMNAPCAKFDALLPQLAELREEGHKSLVFSQFTSFLALLRARLDHDGVVYEYLDGRTRDREERVTRFQTDPDCRLFLISLKAGGLGLNLTAAEYVFLLDPWWNPAVEAQAIDRAHRIGQTRHVFAYRLIASDTVEERIAELQRTKRDLADAIIRADAGVLRDLSTHDLEVLLS